MTDHCSVKDIYVLEMLIFHSDLESPKGPLFLAPDHVQGILTVESTMWEPVEAIQGDLTVKLLECTDGEILLGWLLFSELGIVISL